MAASRIRVSHRPGEVAHNVWDDFDWSGQRRAELLAEYGEGFFLIYERRVIGKGESLEEAIADAERNVPPEVGEVTPIMEYLRHRHLFWRVRPDSVEIITDPTPDKPE